MEQVTVQNVNGNEFDYRGWTVEHSVESTTCVCCGTTTTLNWNAYRRVNDEFQHVSDVSTLQEIFTEIDNRMGE